MPLLTHESGEVEMAHISGTSAALITEPRPASFWRRVVFTPAGLFGLTVILMLLFSAAFADLIAPFSPIKMGAGKRRLQPSAEYFFGTDEFGRDMFSRIIFGSR